MLNKSVIIGVFFLVCLAQVSDADCDYGTPCVSYRRGTVCGLGQADCELGHVYECDGEGTCCHYGPRVSCKRCNKLQCP